MKKEIAEEHKDVSVILLSFDFWLLFSFHLQFLESQVRSAQRFPRAEDVRCQKRCSAISFHSAGAVPL